MLLFGRESAGVPEAVHAAAQARLVIPMRPGLRSLNVAMAAAMALGEALRQTGGFPAGPRPHDPLEETKIFPRYGWHDPTGWTEKLWWPTRSRKSF